MEWNISVPVLSVDLLELLDYILCSIWAVIVNDNNLIVDQTAMDENELFITTAAVWRQLALMQL